MEDIVEVPSPTKELSKAIKPIGKDTVHRICSGQVVLSLAIAIKELVENSVDAGATLIEVKLKEQGLDNIEVSDNGPGVEEGNFSGLTAKYHTSKIREFSDLAVVETFGFRGEALSSLCALSEMVITTKHTTSAFGTRLELDHHGNIKKQTHCARSTGTTVILCKLFNNLPVRKREFTKNIKKEFTKMCQILQAYGMVSRGVRIICTNQNSTGVKTTFMSTHGSQNILDNISAIFGSKQAHDIIQLKSPIDENMKYSKELFIELLQNENTKLEINQDDIDKLNLSQFKIDGWISSCSHGSGRSSKDRQYFFINSRPCDPKNICKIINEVYHRYNNQQYPFIYLNILMERNNVDVNLTPDKRTLLLNNEKILLLAIKKSLINTFGNIPSTFKLNNPIINTKSMKINNTNKDDNDDDNELVIPNSQTFMARLSQWKATGNTIGPLKPNITKRKQDDEIEARTLKLRKIQEYLTQKPTTSSSSKDKFISCQSDPDSDDDDNGKNKENSSVHEMSFSFSKNDKQSKDFDKLLGFNISTEHKEIEESETIRSLDDDNDEKIIEYRIDCKVGEPRKSQIFYETITGSPTSTPPKQTQLIESSTIELDESDDENKSFQTTPEFTNKIQITIDEIKSLVLSNEKFIIENNKPKLKRLKFKTEINPNKNQFAEEELEREITKDMFIKMEIIGQFNLGFIIVRLDNDLFIIDQHATDEKYNFEDLQKSVILQHQPLAVPESLQLTAVDEMILIDNLRIFEANGFKFQIDENGPSTKKVKLLGKPFSKNWEFGKDDIADLIFMLQDAPEDTMCRPPRIRDMFASRACRKSIMIGKALSNSVMRKLINHMGEIEHPWNCPHGRPTMRHLVNLAMLDDQDD